ncbi:cation:proton antiporter [Candidatus Berkiella aquae]|uniref:Cation:proton antiporter n=1 Tax=Candidatus Berkiella aquae TaxID=295108 RepID=A0A0Q9YLQ6_9GAMM|nr:cation:proton antiporter [Candidatus Berkiella aquae]MCS5711597.1 cation:proton antiporter [Candidatus Berkiella aquae]
MDITTLISQLNPLAICGILLILGLIGGQITRLIRFIPKITGYIAVGFIVGPGLLNIVNQSVLHDIKILIDISLGLILFNLGRQLDFTWLKHDLSLLYMSITESLLTFVTVFIAFIWMNFSILAASFAASIAITTSPAVIMLIANDLSSEGPVTRRTLMLTSLNNFWGLILFTLLIPFANPKIHGALPILADYAYKFFGALIFVLAIFSVCVFIGKLITKTKLNQIVLFVGMILITISLAKSIDLSVKLSLFLFGVMVRNLDFKHIFIEVDFEWGIHLAFILLFVITGMQINLHGIVNYTFAVFAFISLRLLAKSAGIWLLAKKSRLTSKQTFSIGLALTPMAGVTIGMLSTLTDFNPEFGSQLTTIIASAVAVLHILGPIATQYAFIRSNETLINRM